MLQRQAMQGVGNYRLPYSRFIAVTFLALLCGISFLSTWMKGENEGLNKDFLTPQERSVFASSFVGRKLLASTCNFNLIYEELPQNCEGDVCCNEVHKIVSECTDNQVCRFVNMTQDCQKEEGVLDYQRFLWCRTTAPTRFAGVILCFLWLLMLFIGLAVVADEFFCPCLAVISDTLRLSPNVAGVTFLAFGNGAPDIFSAIIAVTAGGDPSLAFGSLFGAAVFVTTIVAGSVAIVCPFYAAERPLIRDIAFFMLAVFFTFIILWDGTFYLFEALAYVIIYVLYVIVVIVSHVIYEKQKTREKDHHKKKPWEDDKEETSRAFHNPAFKAELKHSDHEAVEKAGSVLIGYTTLSDSEFDKMNNNLRASSADDLIAPGEEPPASPRVTFRMGSQSSSVGSITAIESTDALATVIEEAIGDMEVFHEDDGGQQTMTAEKMRRSRSTPGTLQEAVAAGDETANLSASRVRKGSAARLSGAATAIKRSVRRFSGTRPEEKLAAMAWTTGSISGEQRLYMRRLRKPRPKKAVKDALRIAENLSVYPLMGPNILTRPREMMPRMSVANFATASAQSDIAYEEIIAKEERQDAEEEEEKMAVFRGPSWKLFLHGINPIGTEDWPEMPLANKLYEIVKAPILFTLLLFTPRVVEDETLHLWNRPLNSLQCMIALPMATILFMGFGYQVWPIQTNDTRILPLAVIVALLGIIPAILVFCTTKSDRRPRLHWIFAYCGFLVALSWIYAFVTELVNIIKTFGTFFNISNALLGLTVLAWGNSIGDYISNVIMAKQGFPRMSISACFGAPLLNLLLGLGLPFTITTIGGTGGVKVSLTLVEMIMIVFVVISLISCLVIAPIRQFYFDRKHGIFLIILYVSFLLMAVLAERKIIPDFVRADRMNT